MIFSVNLKVLSQMLDAASEKCDLHICTACIFFMQLELLEIRRLVAISHNEAPIVDEESIFATGQASFFLSWTAFTFAVIPKAKLFT
jgi:hypothetical protein